MLKVYLYALMHICKNARLGKIHAKNTIQNKLSELPSNAIIQSLAKRSVAATNAFRVAFSPAA